MEARDLVPRGPSIEQVKMQQGLLCEGFGIAAEVVAP